MSWKAAGRWAGIIAFTIAAGWLTRTLTGALWLGTEYYAREDGLTVFTLLGAAAGFWFAWTGRLARLFRKVD